MHWHLMKMRETIEELRENRMVPQCNLGEFPNFLRMLPQFAPYLFFISTLFPPYLAPPRHQLQISLFASYFLLISFLFGSAPTAASRLEQANPRPG